MHRLPRFFLSFSLVLFVFTSAYAAEELLIAAAASLRAPLEAMLPRLKEKGLSITPVFDSSGNLARQLSAGAPYAFFLSADKKWALFVRDRGVMREAIPLVSCPSVLWHKGSVPPSVKLLKDKSVRVAIANPKTSPFGEAAIGYLKKQGLEQALVRDKRLIIAGDAQKAGLVTLSGGADVALIPLSVAKSLGGSSSPLPIPSQTYYAGFIEGRDCADLRAFWDYLRGAEALAIFERTGFHRYVAGP